MGSVPPAVAPAPLRLRIEAAALIENFRWFQARAGVAAIPAVKADGYGLGARHVVKHLEDAGARAFAVSTWAEAIALGRPDLTTLILHGFTPDCTAAAVALPMARPVLNTALQCAEWNRAFPGRPADLMVDTGMNRLGLRADELSAAQSISLHMVHSHLACADLPGHPLTQRQLDAFHDVVASTPGKVYALANSAGVCLGPRFSFDAVRPGLGLYGGVPHPEAQVRRVVAPEVRVIQVRTVKQGETVGYGATWTARRDSSIAILNVGYADAVLPDLDVLVSHDGTSMPTAGRLSMDMLAVDATGFDVSEGDWLTLDLDLPRLSAASGVSQYRLLVGLAQRFERRWT